MSNSNPQSEPIGGSFDFDELSQLFHELDGDGDQESLSEPELDELASLFEDDEPEIAPTTHTASASERLSFSSLPSDEEINQLFSDDLDWEQPATSAPSPVEDITWDNWEQNIPAKSPSPSSELLIDAELSALFEDEEKIIPSPSNHRNGSVSPPLEDDSLAELKYLLEDEPDAAPSLIMPPSQPSKIPCIPVFYEEWESLERLIDKKATETVLTTTTVDFAELYALIDAPAAISPITAHQTASPVPSMSSVAQPVKKTVSDDEFQDIEQLLIDAEQKMGPPTIASTSGSRLQPRPRTQKAKAFEQTMKVSVKQLDNLSNLIGELVVKRNRLEQDQDRLRQFLDNLLNHVQNLSDVGGRMQDLYERTLLEGALLATRTKARKEISPLENLDIDTSAPENGADQDLDALEMDRFTGFHLLSQEMIELIVRVREATSDIQFLVDETDQVARSLRQATTQLQEGMTKSRMMPFSQTTDRLVRPVREIARKLNKQAKLNTQGREVLIDKMIQEHLYSPMTHLVNNAITHGIESPEIRKQHGKTPEGHIAIRAFLQGNQTVITVSDDGSGIDPVQVKRKAIQKGLITPAEANILSSAEVYDFLFHPGFSTRDQADDFAGRGVGLDVVRTGLNDIRGNVTIDSAIGKGTTFTIRLPLTLSICKALSCVSNHAHIAFPMDGVEDMKDVSPHEITLNAEGKRCIRWGQTLLPIHPLGDLLNYNRQLSRGNVYGGKPEDDTVPIVILRGSGNWLAIQVDQVIGEQEIVIKQIEGPAPKPPGIAGATVLGDGSIMPIGDVLELIEIAQGRIRTDGSNSLWRKAAVPTHAKETKDFEPTVLIVDDSITVRELLSLSFNKAGYRVEQARDGQEAWEKLRSGLPCDIVFCDIEMPRMNGLELLSTLQKDEQLADLPVALLTSRGADRHRKVAAKLGASGYFTKPYTERDLLDAAQRMIQGEVLLSGSARVSQSKLPQPIANSPSLDSHSPQKPAPRQKTTSLVLIIDDSVMVREMLSETFTRGGYRYEQARDGMEAWEKLRGGLACDLILCDIEMPRMNGLELLSRLQADEQLSQIPIAMITSRGAQKMQKIAAERGAKGYFVKPYIEEVLLDSAKRLIAGEALLDVGSLVE